MTKLYAKHLGIGDIDVAEAPWLVDWIERHHNSLKYNHISHRWFWVAE